MKANKVRRKSKLVALAVLILVILQMMSIVKISAIDYDAPNLDHIENYSTMTKSDASGFITSLSSSNYTITGDSRNIRSWLYRDYGVGNWTNYHFRTSIKYISSNSASNYQVIWSVSNTIDDWYNGLCVANASQSAVIRFNSGSTPYWRLYLYDGNVASSSYITLSSTNWYYIEIIRNIRELTLKVYSNARCGEIDLVASLSLHKVTATSWRYLYGWDAYQYTSSSGTQSIKVGQLSYTFRDWESEPPPYYTSELPYMTDSYNIHYQIINGLNDAYYIVGEDIFNNNDTLSYFQDSTFDIIGGLRFTNISIPINATIINAKLEFYSSDSGLGNHQATIYGIKDSDYGNFSSKTVLINAPQTNNYLNWNFNKLGWQNTTDLGLTKVVQEIYNQANWTSGNSICFKILAAIGQSYRSYRTYEYTTHLFAAKLYISYSLKTIISENNPWQSVANESADHSQILDAKEGIIKWKLWNDTSRTYGMFFVNGTGSDVLTYKLWYVDINKTIHKVDDNSFNNCQLPNIYGKYYSSYYNGIIYTISIHYLNSINAHLYIMHSHDKGKTWSLWKDVCSIDYEQSLVYGMDIGLDGAMYIVENPNIAYAPSIKYYEFNTTTGGIIINGIDTGLTSGSNNFCGIYSGKNNNTKGQVWIIFNSYGGKIGYKNNKYDTWHKSSTFYVDYSYSYISEACFYEDIQGIHAYVLINEGSPTSTYKSITINSLTSWDSVKIIVTLKNSASQYKLAFIYNDNSDLYLLYMDYVKNIPNSNVQLRFKAYYNDLWHDYENVTNPVSESHRYSIASMSKTSKNIFITNWNDYNSIIYYSGNLINHSIDSLILEKIISTYKYSAYCQSFYEGASHPWYKITDINGTILYENWTDPDITQFVPKYPNLLNVTITDENGKNYDEWLYENEVYKLTSYWGNITYCRLYFNDSVYTIKFEYSNSTSKLTIDDEGIALLIQRLFTNVTRMGNITKLECRFMLDRHLTDVLNRTLYYFARRTFTNIYGMDITGNINNSTGITFNLLNLGGLTTYDFGGDSRIVPNGSPWQLWAKNGTIGSNATAYTYYKNLQHVHAMVEIDLNSTVDGEIFEPEDGSYVEYGFDYRYNRTWIQGWSVRLYVDELRCGTDGLATDKSWVKLRAIWYNNGAATGQENYFYSYDYGYDKDNFPTGRRSYIVWLDLWFSKFNSSTIEGGRVNSYMYGMYEKPWWFGRDFRPMIGNETYSVALMPLHDINGNKISSEQVTMVRAFAKISKGQYGVNSASDDHSWYMRPYQHLDFLTTTDNRLEGIDTPEYIDTIEPELPNESWFQPLINAMKWLVSGIWGGVMWATRALLGGLDALGEWLGLGKGFFTDLLSFLSILPRIMYSFVEFIYSSVSFILDVVASGGSLFVITIGYWAYIMLRTINMIGIFFSILIGMFTGAYGTGFNIWTQLNVSMWFELALILLPIWYLQRLSRSSDILDTIKKDEELIMMNAKFYFGVFDWLFVKGIEIAKVIIQLLRG